jgi:isoleucyl-tRNA synthetase
MDYAAKIKASLLLPKTDFPMRAELPKREPAFLAKWREEKIYDQIMAARKGHPRFVLHDGPPFANGDAHMGHALNMVLKDIVLKYHNMSGHYAPFVPGWDCHGLPIEHKVMKDLGAAETDPIKIREKCETTARHFVGVQSEQFQRLGVFGDWGNPYLTMDPAYEAETLRVFATLVGKNLVYQGLRPVLWSTGCQTALAEAEIEYKEKVDPAIYVKFPLTGNNLRQLFRQRIQLGMPDDKPISLLVWTTTPWTLPANLAVAVSPKLEYAVYEDAGQYVLCAVDRAAQVPAFGTIIPPDQAYHEAFGLHAKMDIAKYPLKKVSDVLKGSDLVGLAYQHPFLKDGKTRQIYSADFVTADAGTGLVHIAPGHGQDDYQLGMQHGLETFSPVDDRGCLTAAAGVPELTGQYVFKANLLVCQLLQKNEVLWTIQKYVHDYPYCWRSKTPIVFRAVKQWFIKVDAFRAEALTAIDGVQFIPENGRNRIRGAVETRPDWCISRQRTWGIPLFYGEGEQPLLSEKVVRKFADLVEKEGAGIWFSRSADELAPALGLPLGLRKGVDTLDVWIDSGTSWAAVVDKRDDLKPAPADLYLEGSDQHRGWFQSSLLTSVAATGQAPYRAVLTNGFVVDTDRKKLSKSNEGYQKPVDLMSLVNEHGADVLRLWVASQDYQNDIPFSHDILARVADTYRSIRNTLRILLGNLADFDASKNSVPQAKWTELDQYISLRIDNLINLNLGFYYNHYQFPQVYQSVNAFCSTDISALYVDVLKDRMYCNSTNDLARRSAQTVMYRMLMVLVKLMAPIIPFTTEEAWKFLKQDGSIHTQAFPDTWLDQTAVTKNTLLKNRWDAILNLRLAVNQKLEEARRDKKIGKALEAHVVIAGRPPLGTAAATSEGNADLEELFIVSKVVIKPTDGEETITVTRAEEHGMKKCVRCWKYWDHVGSDTEHPELCERCTKVVLNWKQ